MVLIHLMIEVDNCRCTLLRGGGNAAIVELLLDHNADPNGTTGRYDRTTPLQAATQKGHADVVSLLKEHGADGWTPLLVAAEADNAAGVKELLEKNADVNQARAKDGRTSLWLAAEGGNAAIVELLLEKNANPNKGTTGHRGTTPLKVATEKGHADIVGLLKEHGADGWTPLLVAAEKEAVAQVKRAAEEAAEEAKAARKAGQFVHVSAFDGNGMVHWIGTGGDSKAYENPHGKPGGVVAKMSSVLDVGEPSRFVDHTQVGKSNGTNSTRNSWMSVDFGEGRQLAPDYYCLRHGYSGRDFVLRNWRLEGSNDDKTWTTLKTHTNDKALAAEAYSTASWPIQAPAAAAAAGGASYRYFRILQYGRNSSDGLYSYDHLHCAGIELYGLLTEDLAAVKEAAALAKQAAEELKAAHEAGQFVHASAFDGNGAVHWIGTGGGTKAYENPHGKPGGVVAKMSSVYGVGEPSRFVDHTQVGKSNGTNSTRNSWMSVDFGEGRQLAPDYYCLRHGYSGIGNSDYVLRNWRLEASNDDKTWTILKTHANDKALAEEAYSTASWPIQAPAAGDAAAAAGGASYRYFRILQYGKNSYGTDTLMCGGIELYGFLTE